MDKEVEDLLHDIGFEMARLEVLKERLIETYGDEKEIEQFKHCKDDCIKCSNVGTSRCPY